jgi:putative heme-binding domain-containing protein
LSSAAPTAPALLETLAQDKEFTRHAARPHLQMLTRLAALVGARPGEAELARAVKLLGAEQQIPAICQVAILQGLGQGLQNSARPLARLWELPPPALKEAVERAGPFFTQAAATARDDKKSLDERISAIRLLGYGPFAVAGRTLPELLGPQNPKEVQFASIRSLSLFDQPKAVEMLLSAWISFSPGARREVLEALFARPERLAVLLDAIEKKQVLAGQLEPFRLEQLRKHSSAKIRTRAQTLLAGLATSDRRKVLEEYQAALDLKSDVTRGKAVFKKSCATCHRLENEGVEVGPDLLSALRNKTREGLLIDILDPSREVDPRYINYLVTTKAGRAFTGMIAAETASSVTLRRAEKAEDTILRSDIEEIQATAKSVMPEGLEMQLSKQDVADVIAYLQAVAVPK